MDQITSDGFGIPNFPSSCSQVLDNFRCHRGRERNTEENEGFVHSVCEQELRPDTYFILCQSVSFPESGIRAGHSHSDDDQTH